MKLLPSWPYPPSRPGYWEPVTSTINWCEEDYYATIYVAEVINTFTNLIFLWLAYLGIANCIKYKHDGVFIVTYLGLGIIAVGSFCFHGTLKYPMQLFDELSMLYTASLSTFTAFSFNRSRSFLIGFAVSLIVLNITVTVYYHFLKDPRFHETVFAFQMLLNNFRSMYKMETTLRPTKTRPGNMAALKTMWALVGYGVGLFLLGFGIWQFDNMYCGTLRLWRHELGMPWALLLEGHGWWHMMTGVGGYTLLTWTVWLRTFEKGEGERFKLHWPRTVFSVPVVVAVDEKKTQ